MKAGKAQMSSFGVLPQITASQRLKTSNTTIGAKQPDLSARLPYDHLDCDPYVVYMQITGQR